MEGFHYDLVPSTFLHCITEQCPLRADCLRSIAYQHIPANVESIRIVNPEVIESVDKNKCPYFLKPQPIRYAKGFRKVLNKLPHEGVKKLRKELIAHFGHSKYYRFLREELPILPQDQEMMQRIFADNGYPEALHFHEYKDGFLFH